MTAYWLILWMVLIGAITQKQNRRRRQMGPRIRITEPEFLKLAEKERGLVIRGPQARWAGAMYLLRSGDYYYYTFSKTPLDLPQECHILESKQIFL
jgi:hypothetical protein